MDELSVSFCSKGRCQFWSRSLHQRYCRPRQNWCACLMRRISWRRVDSDSVENCCTMPAQRLLQALGELFVVGAEGDGGIDAEGRGVRGRRQRRRRDAGGTKTFGDRGLCAGPSMGTIEASGLAV